jgi:hypothetical protein
LSLSPPLADWNDDPTAWGSITDLCPGGAKESRRRNYGTKMRFGAADVFVGVALIGATEKAFGKVEFNPSRVVDPEGFGLATVAESVEAAHAVWEAARSVVLPAAPVDDSRMNRVDVARDFAGVHSSANLIRALAPVHRSWARRNLVHADPQRHGAQTLMVGSGAGVVRLYDKAAETEGRAPEGTVRWEAECRSSWIQNYGGLRCLRGVDDECVGRLAENRWEWSAMGAEVAGASRVVDLVAGSGLSRREQASFLGWLLMQAGGKAWDVGSSATLAKWRRVQRELGIAVGDLADGGSGFVSRLDWESGREVFRAA